MSTKIFVHRPLKRSELRPKVEQELSPPAEPPMMTDAEAIAIRVMLKEEAKAERAQAHYAEMIKRRSKQEMVQTLANILMVRSHSTREMDKDLDSFADTLDDDDSPVDFRGEAEARGDPFLIGRMSYIVDEYHIKQANEPPRVCLICSRPLAKGRDTREICVGLLRSSDRKRTSEHLLIMGFGICVNCKRTTEEHRRRRIALAIMQCPNGKDWNFTREYMDIDKVNPDMAKQIAAMVSISDIYPRDRLDLE
jgi:hypothetical protein